MEIVKEEGSPSVGAIQAEGISEIYSTFGLKMTSLKSLASFATSIALKISEEVCQFHRIVPIEVKEDGTVVIAMADPLDMVAVQIIRAKIKQDIATVWADSDEIEFAIGSIFSDKNTFPNEPEPRILDLLSIL